MVKRTNESLPPGSARFMPVRLGTSRAGDGVSCRGLFLDLLTS